MHLIEHIKGTLIQYLKNVPLTDAANEALLKIIFSMMSFTDADVVELNLSRMVLKGSNQKASQMLQKQGSTSKSNMSSGLNISTGSDQQEKKKKGLLSIFNRNSKTNEKGNSSRGEQTALAPQPKPGSRIQSAQSK